MQRMNASQMCSVRAQLGYELHSLWSLSRPSSHSISRACWQWTPLHPGEHEQLQVKGRTEEDEFMVSGARGNLWLGR